MDIIISNKHYKIIKQLGYGMIGTVFLVENNEKRYALKIEHILERDVKRNTTSDHWREIDFCEKFGNKHPEQFIKLVDYDIIDTCLHKQKYSSKISLFPKKMQKYLLELSKSKYCVRRIYTLVDSSLDKILQKLSIKQCYSLIIQLIYVLELLHDNNYIHGDIHTGNIGYIKTNKKYIKIYGYSIPTFGYIFKPIDYGLILNKKYVKNKIENKKYNDILAFEIKNLKYMFIHCEIWNLVNQYGIKLNFEKDYKILKKMHEHEILKQLADESNDIMCLFEILYAEKHQRLVLGDRFKKLLPIEFKIPLADILFFIKANRDYKTIVKYFYEKLKT